MHIMGHRGAPADEPENTLRCIRRALAMGVAAVELDVQLTKDGESGGDPRRHRGPDHQRPGSR